VLAFRRVMESDLPITWCPCFAGSEVWSKGPHGAWWQFEQGALFDRLSPRLQSYFAYALLPMPLSVDPIRALTRPGLAPLVSEDWRTKTWEQQRSMWSTASLLDAAGRQESAVSFTPMTWRFDDAGAMTLQPDEQTWRRVLTVPDEAAYQQAMFARLLQLLTRLGR